MNVSLEDDMQSISQSWPGQAGSLQWLLQYQRNHRQARVPIRW